MNYIVIQAVTLVLALLVFRLVLSRTTLHRFNRVVLLSVIILSFVLPLVHVTIPQKQSDVILAPITEYVAEPVEYIMPEYIEVVPVENTPSPTVAPAPARHINWSRIASVIWLAGAVFFLLRLLMGIVRAETISRRKSRTLADGTRLVLSDLDCQPSSWRRTIIMSRRDYEDNGPQIIAHEQAHIRCRHSIDVVVASLCCAVQWFNPASWMLGRSLKQIHEYEADDTVLRNGYDSRRYQSCLIRAALQQRFSFVTSNFADCSTKKRINMMNRNQSSPWARISVLLMLPVALFAILLASACKPSAKQSSIETIQTVESPVETAPIESEKYDTAAFLAKYGLPENVKVEKLNKFVHVENDGGIWIEVNRGYYSQAHLSNFETEFNRLTDGVDYQWAKPEMVFVTYSNPAHLEVCVDLVEILEKYYSTENIRVFKELPKVIPPPPSVTPKYGYNMNREKDKCLSIIIDDNNRITFTAWNGCSPDGSGRIVPATVRQLGTVDEVRNLLGIIFPNPDEKVLYIFTPDNNSSVRIRESVHALLNDSRYIRAPYNRGPENMTHKDSIDYIILGKGGSSSSRSRHIKDMKWYNENKDKDNFFRMGFIGGKLCVCKGNDASKLAPIAFDQLVPYFKENCPDGNERNAIVLFELPADESVSVEYLDQILTKLEGWITTFTKRLYLSPTHIE